MEIGDWKAMAGMAQVYRQARELGLETNLAELETFGFTVIEPAKTRGREIAERLLEKVNAIVRQEDAAAVDLNKHADKPAYGRQLFHLLERDPVFCEAMMHPVVRVMGAYMMGLSFRLYSMVAFNKDGTARSTHMHTDSVGVPTPLPHYGVVCNVSWILSQYTPETGTFGFVPGSHRFCRHPTQFEQPKFMQTGGHLEDDMVVPALATPGSLVVFTGNTWHCTYPKTSSGVRAHVVSAFCRNFVNPAEDYSDMPQPLVERFGQEFARIVGQRSWQGYRADGPKLENMALVRPAYQTQYG